MIVVGNGPSVTSGKWGDAIDGHLEVIRFGAYRMEDFAECTGVRTTMWAASEECRKTVRPPRDCQEIVICEPGKRQAYTSRGITAMERLHASVDHPSSGLILLESLAYQGIRPTFIGIDGYDRAERRNYWSDDPIPDDDPHDYDQEVARLSAMIQDGLIVALEDA